MLGILIKGRGKTVLSNHEKPRLFGPGLLYLFEL
jgi:hypothetical protein